MCTLVCALVRALVLGVGLLLTGCVLHPSSPLPTSAMFPECVAYPYQWSRVLVYDGTTTVDSQCVPERDLQVWDKCREELKAFRDTWRRIEDARR